LWLNINHKKRFIKNAGEGQSFTAGTGKTRGYYVAQKESVQRCVPVSLILLSGN